MSAAGLYRVLGLDGYVGGEPKVSGTEYAIFAGNGSWHSFCGLTERRDSRLRYGPRSDRDTA